MPYHVGEKGSYGCKGYPALKDDGTVMGCHTTAEEAANQIYAINVSEGNVEAEKSMPTLTDEELDQVDKKNPCWEGYVQRGMKEKDGRMVPNCVPASKSELGANESGVIVSKEDGITEGNFVMGMTTEGIAHGMVEHIMWEGGTLGTPGSEYALESMPPENPAMSVRLYEEDEEGMWSPTAYSIGMMYQDATKLESLDGHTMDGEDEDMEYLNKADTYAPTSGMKAAARRALKWKEDGKATGAGTPVGWGRASDIVAGRSMSLSVVKRMYSFFSRHEVDKKGKGFSSGPEFPSNGRIMWDAWGGDAGFSWSRAIVQREMDKVLFQGFGKDFTQTQRLTQIFPE
jgi:hypothetical protein